MGTLVSYNDPALAIENGSAICFDYVMVPPTHTITFQVVVNEDAVTGPLTNVALHSTDRLGTAEEVATAVVDLMQNMTSIKARPCLARMMPALQLC